MMEESRPVHSQAHPHAEPQPQTDSPAVPQLQTEQPAEQFSPFDPPPGLQLQTHPSTEPHLQSDLPPLPQQQSDPLQMQVILMGKPTEQELRHVCSVVGREWKKVCTFLGIPKVKVDLYNENNKSDVAEAFFEALCYWHAGNTSKEVTWSALLEAMRKAGLRNCVEELQKKLPDIVESRPVHSQAHPHAEPQPQTDSPAVPQLQTEQPAEQFSPFDPPPGLQLQTHPSTEPHLQSDLPPLPQQQSDPLQMQVILMGKPTEQELRHVCSVVGREWKKVCTFLGIPKVKVDLYIENNKSDVAEAFFEALCYWHAGNTSKEVTWSALLEAMRKAGLRNCVEELQKKLPDIVESRPVHSQAHPHAEPQPQADSPAVPQTEPPAEQISPVDPPPGLQLHTHQPTEPHPQSDPPPLPQQQSDPLQMQVILMDKPTEEELRHVCSVVGREWRAVCNFLGIPRVKVDLYIENNKHDVAEAFFQALCYWHAGNTSKEVTWSALLEAMRKVSLHNCVEELRKKLPDIIHVPADAEWPEEALHLKQRAYSQYRCQQFILGEGSKANVEEVKLAVENGQSAPRPNDLTILANTDDIAFADLLRKNDENRIRVVYGQAGSGKTTMLRQMCKTLSNDESKSDFQLVLYFELRKHSISSKNLEDLLSYYTQDEEPAASSVVAEWMDYRKGKGVLLVFDGADEMKNVVNLSNSSFLTRLFEGRCLPEVHIIISSRPRACPLEKYGTMSYKVQGFNHNAVKSYVVGFFKADPAAAQKMLSEMEDRPDLLAGTWLPINCFILCSIFEDSFSFPATMTACYQAFTCYKLTREYHTEGRKLDLDPKLESLPSDVKSLLNALGALSFEGLQQSPQKFNFDPASICSAFSYAPGTAINSSLFKGLLQVHPARNRAFGLYCSFPHAIQQGFFAARHLSQLREVDQAGFWKMNLFNSSFSDVLPFFAGLTHLHNDEVAEQIRCVITGVPEGGSILYLTGTGTDANPHLLQMFYSLYESQNEELIEKVMRHIPKSLTFAVKRLSTLDTWVISRCLLQCTHDHLEKLIVGILSSAKSLLHIRDVFKRNPGCVLDGGLYIDCDTFSSDDANTLSDIAASLRSLALTASHTDCAALSTVFSIHDVIDLAIIIRNDVKGGSGWNQVRRSIMKKEFGWLGLDGCDDFLTNMGKVLTGNVSIPELKLYRRGSVPDPVAGALGNAIAAMTQLKHLEMCELPLPVLKALAQRNHPLEKLYVFKPGVNWGGLSEDQWKEAKEAAASAKVRHVWLEFSDKSRQRSRTIELLDKAFTRNTVVRVVEPNRIRKELEEPVAEFIPPAKCFRENDCSMLYCKAIRDNPTVPLHIAKAMTIGPPQVGKTSLFNHLLGLPPPDGSSTPVMKTAEIISVHSSDSSALPDEAGLVTSSGATLSINHSSDSENEASSDDSEDDVGQSAAKRPCYNTHTCVVDRNSWVTVNNDSGILSLLTFLQQKIDSITHSQSSTDQVEVTLEQLVSETRPLGTLPSTHKSETPNQPSGDTSFIQPADDTIPIQPSHDTSSIQPADDVGNLSDSIATMIKRIYCALKNPVTTNVILPDAHLLQFLDCGGQLAHHDILPIFVNIPAIYLYVFNVAKELTECPIDELCSIGGRKKYSAKSALTVAEMVTRSAMTVHSLADRKVQLPSEVKCESKSPKSHIVLVGTHLDNLVETTSEAKLQAVNETLLKSLQSKSHCLEGMVLKNKEPHHLFFPINNKLYVDQSHQLCKHGNCKHCRATKHLKSRLTKQAMDDAVKVEVPVKWYIRQLLELSQGAEKPLYSYSELYQRCKEEGSIADIGEFHAMVTYFHVLGLLVHLCGADVGHTEDSDCLVFTNPSYLFENISKLYQVQFEEGVEGVGKIMLKREGKLTKEALQDLEVQLDHKYFMDLLVQLFIGAEVRSHTGERILFVPSVLTNSPDDVSPSGVDARLQEHSLCFAITFEDKHFISCGVFTGMIARLQSTPEWEICTHSLSRIHMEFAVGARATIILIDYATHISVEIECHEGMEHRRYQEDRDTIIKATADSYCFLFHSKAAKVPQSGTCSECTDSPYLVLGQTCQKCPAPSSAPEVPHFAKLKVEDGLPVSVRCQITRPKLKLLSQNLLEVVLFQNMSYYAVVKEQHTSYSLQGVGLEVPPPQPAEQVLEHFRVHFIKDVDAKEIVYELKHENIISDSDVTMITGNPSAKQQNEFLHAQLHKKCHEGSLMVVCDLMIAVKGNMKMNALGSDMKCRLKKALSRAEFESQEMVPQPGRPRSSPLRTRPTLSPNPRTTTALIPPFEEEEEEEEGRRLCDDDDMMTSTFDPHKPAQDKL